MLDTHKSINEMTVNEMAASAYLWLKFWRENQIFKRGL